jgi:ubiquinone/menaquinone biosynthesis C-methylase UbiE
MPVVSSAWTDEENARRYEEYALKFPLYRESGRKLVEFARINPGATVMELACGTGIVTEQVLSRVGDAGTVNAVDMSPAMLAIARTKIQAANVRFFECPTERLSDVLPEAGADFMVCNSAFWQMERSEALAAVSFVLKEGGRFALDVPEAFSVLAPSQPARDSLLVLLLEVAARDYGYLPPPRRRRRSTGLAVGQWIEHVPLVTVARDELEIERTAEDLYEFYKIPVMTLRYLPGLDYAVRMSLLDLAYQRYDKAKRITSKLLYFALEKRSAGL